MVNEDARTFVKKYIEQYNLIQAQLRETGTLALLMMILDNAEISLYEEDKPDGSVDEYFIYKPKLSEYRIDIPKIEVVFK